MRCTVHEPAASAMLAFDSRAAAGRDHRFRSRFDAQAEMVRKAWQVVLCARWESRRMNELAPAPARRTTAGGEGTAKGLPGR